MSEGTILVYGATGVQGGAVAAGLLAAGRQVRVLTRRAESAAELARRGAEVVEADLNDPASLRAATAGVARVALLLPLEYNPDTAIAQGRAAIDAARAAGVRQLVFNTSTRLPVEITDVAGFEIKRELEIYLRASAVPAVVLRPTFYMENFAGPWTAPAIGAQGVIAYPVPRALRAAWISADDAAAYTLAALDRPDLAGATLEIGGPELLDGDDLAGRFAAALGRQMAYLPIASAVFAQQLSQVLGPDAAAGIAAMYHWMEQNLDTSLFRADPTVQQRLPVALTPLEQWVRARSWAPVAVS